MYNQKCKNVFGKLVFEMIKFMKGNYFKNNTNVAKAAKIPTKIKAFLIPWYFKINSLIMPL